VTVRFLDSPRRRRRYAVGLLIAAVGLGVSLLIAFERNTSPPHDAKLTNEPVVVPTVPKTVQQTKSSRVQALLVAAEFVRTAVARQHPERAWDISSPSLRAGDPREAWVGGEIPVPPFPVETVRWRPDYSYKNALGMQVALFPKPKTQYRPMVFFIDLKRYGRGKTAHWLVDAWSPAPGAASFGIAAGAPTGGGSGPLGSAVAQATGDHVLGASWLLVPVGIFILMLLIPIVVGLRGWLRDRRVDRLAGKDLPQLGHYTSSSKPS
jgi:hypothetical protein